MGNDKTITRSIVIFAIIVLGVCQFNVFRVEAITDASDAKVMSALKEAWENTVPSNWQGNTDPCGNNWEGINCTNDQITSLFLPASGLKGIIPDEIGSLRNLVQLDLSYNNGLTGNLPDTIGDLTNLQFLTLIGCRLTGEIPESLGNLVNLTFLALNSNNFTGKLPASLGKLEKVDWLDISDNEITGTLPVSNGKQSGLDKLVNTQHFHFGQNKLTGAIPAKLFSSKMKLIHILFDDNEFNGTIPTSLTEVETLQALRLDRNSFTGEIPSTITNLTNLCELNLANNELSGTIPNLSKLTSLQYMDVSNNSFQSSEFPSWITDTQNLNTILMEGCQLAGEIPDAVFDISGLENLNLANNQLNGSVSIDSAQASHLETVNLEYNRITNARSTGNVTLLLEGNPYCEGSNSESNSLCQSKDVQQETYETNLSRCKNPECKKGLDVNPQTCGCQQPYSGQMIFKAPFFSSVTNGTRFRDLEYDFLSQLPIGGVFLTCHNFDSNSYLIVDVKFFPSRGSTSFATSDVSEISYKLAKDEFDPPSEFGPYIFLADEISEVAESKRGLSAGAIAGIVIAAVVLLVTGSSAVLFALKQKRRADKAIEAHKPFAALTTSGDSSGFPDIKGARFFTFEEMKRITNGFSVDNEIGRGGYGTVYKGMVDGNRMVAIKRARLGLLQGVNQFRNEIELLSRVHHKNLVGLVGFCFDQGEQMLVYEYISNGTLTEALQGKRDLQLSWTRRLQVALDSARGLAYLHENANPPIIHRDIKGDNILLDKNLVAKVADFGLSKLFDSEDQKSYITTQVRGTMGYLDPEYYLTQRLTEKSDVYSLGIVMLELITARRPIQDGRHIVRVVRESIEGGITRFREEILDPTLKKLSKDSHNLQGLERFLNLALRCAEEDEYGRPSMRTVVKELEEILESINGVSEPQSRNQSTVKNLSPVASFYANLDIEMGDSSSSACRSHGESSMFSHSSDSFTKRKAEPK